MQLTFVDMTVAQDGTIAAMIGNFPEQELPNITRIVKNDIVYQCLMQVTYICNLNHMSALRSSSQNTFKQTLPSYYQGKVSIRQPPAGKRHHR